MRFMYLISGVWAASWLVGCDSLGDCTDPAEGRTPVLVGNQVMYAGQAIINRSCASGSCHSEGSSRNLRRGAPAGLDFDLIPAEATPTADGSPAELKESDLSRLRKHQRKVFDQRHAIWEQIERGLMPPDGLGESFRTASAGALLEITQIGSPGCPVTTELEPITEKSTRDLLRSWLACGAPIVEANVAGLSKPIGGTAGDQFPACVGDLEPTFDNVYKTVFTGGAIGCVSGCHEPGGGGGAEDFDLSTPAIAYASLMGANGMGKAPTDCDESDAFMVVPGQPTESYFYAKVGGEGEKICGELMPFGSESGLFPQDLDLVRRWIEAGAPGPGVAVGTSDAGASANDAGAGENDAGGMDAGT